jgi:hypothetical protein
MTTNNTDAILKLNEHVLTVNLRHACAEFNTLVAASRNAQPITEDEAIQWVGQLTQTSSLSLDSARLLVKNKDRLLITHGRLLERSDALRRQQFYEDHLALFESVTIGRGNNYEQ